MNNLRITAALASLLLFAAAFAQGLPRETRLDIVAATVQIVPLDEATGYLADSSGSGTIISPSGYILTNFHVIGDLDSRKHHHWAAIFWTDPDFTDQPPEPMFWAEYVTSDPTHDLALLQITEWFDETPVADQQFPFALVGDSNALIPGDPVTFVGYPSISGRTITFTGGYMSGWVGEDFTSGGKQWIKTDGKIAHGNSGGGAYNEHGHLIGVPTAGRTIEYERLDREEQAYIRPISLAWALMGPFVPDVARAPTTGKTGASIAATQTPGATSGAASEQCLDYCFQGVLGTDDATSATIAFPAGNSAPSFHTYVIDVPAGTSELTISAFGDGDIDMVVGHGEPIDMWSDGGNWAYRDYSHNWSAMVTIPNPTPGDWYVDIVLYYEGETIEYDLFTFTDPIIGEQFFEVCVSCVAGDITPGTTVQAVLNGYEDFLNYHTYNIVVPEGQDELRITVEADGDIDIALKYGSEIDDWGDGGNWDYADETMAHGGEFIVNNPAAGVWYLDVFTYYQEGTYTYTVTANTTAASDQQTTAASAITSATCERNCTMAELGTSGAYQAVLRNENGATSSYHTYVVEVPAGTEQLQVTAAGNNDFDMVIGHGSPVNTWLNEGNWNYRGTSVHHQAAVTFPRPAAGIWYIDVVVFGDGEAVNYEIQAQVGKASGASLAEPCTSCYIGDVTPGVRIEAALNSYEDFSNYHTYSIVVPEEQNEMRVRVDATGDIDIAMKHGEPIDTWGSNGNWDYRDDSFSSGGEFVVPNPAAGEWYIDVYTLYSDIAVTYTLEAQTR